MALGTDPTLIDIALARTAAFKVIERLTATGVVIEVTFDATSVTVEYWGKL
jgi:hypothetical protein